jgi:hypothetical protein
MELVNGFLFCIGTSSFILGIVLLAQGQEYGLIAFMIGLVILFLCFLTINYYLESSQIAPSA